MARKFQMRAHMILKALREECDKAEGPVIFMAIRKNLEREHGYRVHHGTVHRTLTRCNQVEVIHDKREGEPNMYLWVGSSS